ncbi:MAG: tetratricopeptide repeat protein [Chloroflexota bacterium]
MQVERYTLFGQWLRNRRKALDLTREKLSICSGCSPSTIEKMESGERRPSAQLAELLAHCLRVPTEEIATFVVFARGGQSTFFVPETRQYDKEERHILQSTTLMQMPVQATDFVGRESEVEEIRGLLRQSDVRMLTLLGPPGIGKTRLSVEGALGLGRDFPDGVYFVALSTITDPTLAIRAVAAAVGLQEVGHLPILDTMKEWLQGKRILLVLDNFEHVLAAGVEVATLLAESLDMKMVITSRVALHAYEEHIFRVPPMHFPEVDTAGRVLDETQLERLARFEAVELFAQRARAVRHDFMLGTHNIEAITAICRKLDGLPLAIELAAFRANVLSPQIILEKLEHSLDLLTNGPVNLPERQRSLRAAVAWSYSLLDPDAQLLFRRLSVFVGGCDFRAIEQIDRAMSGDDDGGEHGKILLDTLATLVDNSLLQRYEDGNEPRFSMLETMREYALEQLAESGEEDLARQAHANYYLGLAEQIEPEIMSANQPQMLDRLQRDHDNLRATLRYFLECNNNVALARLAGALRRFWYFRGHLTEGMGWLRTAISYRDQLPPASVAKIVHSAGTVHWVMGEFEQANSYYEDCLAIYRSLGDRVGVANILNNMGVTYTNMGDYETPIGLYMQSLEISRETGNEWTEAVTLSNLGLSALNRGDYEEAQRWLDESLEVRQDVHDKQGIAQSLNNLGIVARCRRDFARSHRLHTEALEKFRELSDRWSIGLCLVNMGNLAMDSDAPLEEATQLFRKGLVVDRELGVRPGMADCFDGLARIASQEQRWEIAAVLFGAAEKLREEHGIPLVPYGAAAYMAAREAVVAALGEKAFDECWMKGRTMSLERACTRALTEFPLIG